MRATRPRKTRPKHAGGISAISSKPLNKRRATLLALVNCSVAGRVCHDLLLPDVRALPALTAGDAFAQRPPSRFFSRQTILKKGNNICSAPLGAARASSRFQPPPAAARHVPALPLLHDSPQSSQFLQLF
jgi:hypothetical protein